MSQEELTALSQTELEAAGYRAIVEFEKTQKPAQEAAQALQAINAEVARRNTPVDIPVEETTEPVQDNG